MEIKKVRKTYYIKDVGECVEAFDYEVKKWQDDVNLEGVKFVLWDDEILCGVMTLTPDQVRNNVVNKDTRPQRSKIDGSIYYLWAFIWNPDDPNQLTLGI